MGISNLFPYLWKEKLKFMFCMFFCILDGITVPSLGAILGQFFATIIDFNINPLYQKWEAYKLVIIGCLITACAIITNSLAWYTSTLMG